MNTIVLWARWAVGIGGMLGCGKDEGGADVARDATPLGLGDVVGVTQGRPAWRSPTLG